MFRYDTQNRKAEVDCPMRIWHPGSNPKAHQTMKTPVAILTLLSALFFTGCESTKPQPTKPATHAYTPAKNSPERAAILVGVREALAKQDSRKVVLIVPSLKVHDGWAWIQVNPQSPDGKNHYESQSGLLREKAKKWTLLEWMPAEEGTNYKTYFQNLKAKYPAAPADIFPK